MMTGRCEFIRDDGECWAGRGTCPHSFREGALSCPSFAPHQPGDSHLSALRKQAAWADVAAKGRAIYEAGGVEITKNDSRELDALVMSGDVGGEFPVTDGGPYPVILAKTSWNGAPNYGGWVQAYFCECFTPDTKVLMAGDVRRRICDVNVGSHVLTSPGGESPTTGELVPRRVSGAKWHRHSGVVRTVSFGDGHVVTCTMDHPWWVRRGIVGWVRAADIEVGDEVLSPVDGALSFVAVTMVTNQEYHGVVCNLEIEDAHTYVANGALVHNCAWGQYHSGRPGQGGGRFGGRMCSHAYAAMLAADGRARKDFMNDRIAGLMGTCARCGEYAALDPVNGLCRDCEDERTFDAFVAAVYMGDEAAERWLESEGDVGLMETIDSRMTLDPVDGDVRLARWDGHRALVTPRTASVRDATRKFTYAEMQELDDEIDGRSLHNRNRLKAITEDL